MSTHNLCIEPKKNITRFENCQVLQPHKNRNKLHRRDNVLNSKSHRLSFKSSFIYRMYLPLYVHLTNMNLK